MKKFLLIMIIILGMLSTIYSQSVKILTFDEAVNIALQNNKDLLVEKINFDNANLDYENKKKDPTTLVLSLKQSELSAKLGKVKYENTKLQVIQSVRSAYFSVLEAEAQLKLLQKQLDYYKEQFNAVKIKYQVGNATAVDVQEAELNYLSAQNSLVSGENSLSNAWSQFWQVLGISPIENIQLQEPSLVTFNFNLDELFNIAQENLPSIVQAKNNVELYELQVKLYDNDYTPKADLISAKNSLDSAKMTLEQTLNSTKLSISQSLDQLNLSLKNIEIQQKNLDLAQENYKIAQIRFDAGLITKIDLMNTEINIISAENACYSALHNYWKNLDTLSIAVGKALYEGGEAKK
ncbi:MAG: TolC family protein [Dictyoglomaceae bacterium]|nr:TolC family protein [Dictyoglomaceae bacterium]